jgi:4,5-DOPA dioxygenase extradiol
MTEPNPTRMPVAFVAHGSPFLLDDAGWVKELADWAHAMPRPSSILMISAHWERRPISIGATTTVPLVYDFYGFPQRYYATTYPSPGAPRLAARVNELLAADGPVEQDPRRGLDHGAYVPLVAMYPAADIPVLQLSLPTMDAPSLFALGRRLAPLRDEGVLVVGSGFLSHNLRVARELFGSDAPPPAWAVDFDRWAEDVIARRDVDVLLDYRRKAPALDLNLPTHEHFVPVVVAMGATEDRDAVTFPITGWMAGLTRRSVQLG